MEQLNQIQKDKLRKIVDKSIDESYDDSIRFSSQSLLPLFVVNENGLAYDSSHGSFYKINTDSKLSVGDFLYVNEHKFSPSSSTLNYKEKGKDIVPRRLNIIDSITSNGINQNVLEAQKYSSNVDKVQNFLKPGDLNVIQAVNNFVYDQK